MADIYPTTSGSAVSVPDGSDVAEGSKADAAYTGSGSASDIAILKALYAALTDGTADSLVHQARDSARQTVILRIIQTPGQSAELALTITPIVDGVAGSTVTHYEPPAGKTLRMQSLSGFQRTPAGNTAAAPAKIRIRQNTAAAATTSSVELESLTLGGTTPINFFTATTQLTIPEGHHIKGDGTNSIAITSEIPLRAATTADPELDLVLVGYLY